MGVDPFKGYGNSLSGPIENIEPVTPNDVEDLEHFTRALNCSAAGTVRVDMIGVGTNVEATVVPGWNPMRVSRVYATGTDAGLSIRAGW